MINGHAGMHTVPVVWTLWGIAIYPRVTILCILDFGSYLMHGDYSALQEQERVADLQVGFRKRKLLACNCGILTLALLMD